MLYLKEILSGVVKQAEEAAVTNYTAGTQPSEAPDAPIGHKTKKKVMTKLLNGETPRAAIVEPKKVKRGDSEQKLETADATAPEEINEVSNEIEKAASLRMGMLAFGNLMQKQAGVAGNLLNKVVSLATKHPKTSIGLGTGAVLTSAGTTGYLAAKATDNKNQAAEEAKAAEILKAIQHSDRNFNIKHRLRRDIPQDALAAEDQQRQADDLQNLGIGAVGGALAGAAGGATYDQFKPEGSWSPSMVTTTAGGAGLGLAAAFAINKMKKKQATA